MKQRFQKPVTIENSPAMQLTQIQKTSQLMAWMLRQRPSRTFLMIFGSALATLIGLGAPVSQKLFVDLVSKSPTNLLDKLQKFGIDVESRSPLIFLFLAFALVLLMQWLQAWVSWIGTSESLDRQRWLGDGVFLKMLQLRADQLTRLQTGELVALSATDVPGSTAILDQTIPIGVSLLFPFVMAPLTIQWICGIPVQNTIVAMVGVLSLSILLSIRQARFFQKFKRLAGERTGVVNEWIQNLRMLRILGWIEAVEKKIFIKREEETVNRVKMVTNGQMMGAFGSTMNFVVNLVGIWTLTHTEGFKPTPGDFFAMLWIFAVFLSRPFRQVPWVFTFTFDALTSARRLAQFFAIPTVGQFKQEQQQLSASLGLRVRGLNLTLDSREILSDINIEIAPKEFVVVVGEVGSGKTALLLSLIGEYPATFASYQWIQENQNHSQEAQSTSDAIQYVPQEGFIMSSSIRDNIIFEYNSKSRNGDNVQTALRLADFEFSTRDFPEQEATEIGERGVNLSGGQKQRIALARAHELNKPIVFLDDSLSAVDVETEQRIMDRLILGAWENRTRLMVTHRLTVLPRADRVVFMQEGRIADSGTFAELQERSAAFRNFTVSLAAGKQRSGSESESSL